MNKQEQFIDKNKLLLAATLLHFDILTSDGYFVVSNYHRGNTILKTFPDTEEGYNQAIAFMRENML